MKINKLAVKNFRNHKNTTIELDNLNIFIGPNNSGKSSILAAIEWALTGRNFWTDKAGRGANDLITQGKKTCQVALDIEGFGEVVRGLPPHSLIAGRFNGIQEGQMAIYNHLGTTDEKLIQLLMNSGSFISMPSTDQKTFLFNLCGISFSQEKIKQAVFKMTDDEEIVKRAIQLMPGKIDADPGILHSMEKKARDMRKDTKKELERTKAALTEMESPSLPDGIGLDDKIDVSQQLKELEQEKDNLLKSIGESQAAKNNETYLRDKHKSLTDEISRLAKEKEKKNTELATTDKAKTTLKLAELKIQRGQLEETLRTFDQETIKLESELAAKLPIIEVLNNFDGKCPLAPDLINCQMNKDEITSLIEKLNSECDQARKNIKTISDEISKLNDYNKTNHNKTSHLENILSNLSKLENEISSLDISIARAQKELAGIENELSIIEKTKTNEVDPDAVTHLDDHINKGREILRQLDLAEHVSKQTSQLQNDLKVLQNEVSILESLVNVLGPNGISESLFGIQLKDFTGQLNKHLSLLTEGHYMLEWEEDLTPVITKIGSKLPIKLLSKSEQFRLGIAFQIAIAKQAGIKFLAIDEVDMLDQVNKSLLSETMIEQMHEFDQILMFCTAGDVLPKKANIDGLKMFWVENGKVSDFEGSDE